MEVVRLLVGPGGRIACRNAYELRECDFKERHLKEKQVTIAGGARPPSWVLVRPTGGTRPYGSVGTRSYGPVGTRPYGPGRAEAGYAVLSWDGPGVNGAPGNWLSQDI
ncbi:hypothetical protein EYS09_22660 [Streptomyces kasugaensis]|uniref:Uncharacterized protein n=1 Tax=Streptomyces kasugaensis TaxID=1946 RepID=A0A4Q9HR50_STRKA|nr:hypothetical protein [Streptomyces kasugaensis]TBO57444.1 hypothetical protein EYS09_22660 [Streptomyces kasugaensis]